MKFFSAVCLLLLYVHASANISADPPISKVIDKRSKIDVNRYYVVFCARNNTLSGHAFVVAGIEDEAKQLSSADAFGLYPVKEGDNFKSFFTKVPGNIVSEYTRDIDKGTANMQAEMLRLIIKVDKEDYDLIDKTKNTWAGRKDFQLIENDCVTFVMEVATKLGLSVPERNMTDKPWGYIGKLLAKNKQNMYADGVWESVQPKKRFILEIKNDKCTWTERNDAGTEIKRPADLIKVEGGFKISRDNDDAVLAFLGFQPSLRAEIRAKGPRPSFLVISRTETNLTANWHGLTAKKDQQAHLTELIQPDQATPVVYTFKRIE